MKLQHTLVAIGLLFTAAVYVQSAPAGDNQELDVLQIPLTNGKELDVLTLGARDQEQLIADRNKRTIGLLRELFPDITKEVNVQIDRYVNTILRLFGPTLLGTILNPSLHQGGRRNFTALNGDDDAANDDVTDGGDGDDDETTTTGVSDRRNSKELPKLGGSPGQSNLTVFEPDEDFRQENGDADEKTPKGNGDASDTQIDLSAINKQLEETIRVARQVKEAEAALQQQQQQQSQSQSNPQQYAIPQPKREETIQLSFNNEVSSNGNGNDDTKSAASVSNELQLSESKSPAIDDLTLDSAEDTADLDDRNKSNLFKRFLSFGGGAGLAGGSSGGSGGAGGAGAGGSGNFLFDIVRLFSGSVQTQAGDEAANSVAGAGGDSSGDSDSNRAADGYTEAIPGPVTRLVVLANRGLANLIQDLILRVAATSEKFVNFKAKLITALI